MFRLQNNILQTPIIELQNQESGTSIDLVGVLSIGKQGYYDAISEYLAAKEAEGALIHYESVYHSQMVTTMPEMQRPLPKRKNAQDIIDLCIRAYGLVHQMDAIKYKPNWERHDAVAEEAREAGVFPEPVRGALIDKVLNYLPSRLLRPVLNFGFDLATNPEGVQGDATNYDLYRERIAVDAAVAATTKEEAAHTNLAMLWTAAHLPNFRHDFTTNHGYEQVNERWLNAFPLSKP